MKIRALNHRLALTLTLICVAIAANATDFTYEGLIYTILTDNTCQTKAGQVYGSYGSYTYYAGNKVSGSIVIPSTVYDTEGNAYTVTKIADRSFYSCTGLTSITIPNSVTSIGNYAFYGCSDCA